MRSPAVRPPATPPALCFSRRRTRGASSSERVGTGAKGAASSSVALDTTAGAGRSLSGAVEREDCPTGAWSRVASRNARALAARPGPSLILALLRYAEVRRPAHREGCDRARASPSELQTGDRARQRDGRG